MARARSSNTAQLIGAAAVLGGLYFLLTRKAHATATPGPAIAPPSMAPGAIAPTGSQITAAAAIWQNLTPTTGPYAGFVNFPTGSQAPAAFLSWATDGAGNYYTEWAGQIYIVGVGYTDANGNYTAKLLGT